MTEKTRLYFTISQICIGSYEQADRAKNVYGSDDFLLPDGYTVDDAIGKLASQIRSEIATLRSKNFIASRLKK
jgi:uncharacterized protein YxjI